MCLAPLVISIDGNIGSGKSTLLNRLKESLSKLKFTHNINVVFLQEPVELWESFTDEDGETIISKFYRDQEKWSFAFQIMAYISRLSILKKAIKENPNSLIITERCVDTDRWVFAKMLYDAKKMNLIEYTIYLKCFEEFKGESHINGIVYLDVKPDNCYKRVEKRSREGESIPLDYLQQCEKYHTDWLTNLDYSTSKLTLDGNADTDANPEIVSHWVSQIEKFIDTTYNNRSFNLQNKNI